MSENCRRCGSDEFLGHRLNGALKDPNLCTLCQGQLKKQQDDEALANGKPTLKVSFADLLKKSRPSR